MPGSVFVSYSGQRDQMARLVTALRRHGMRPWRDAESLPFGGRTDAEIRRELADCHAAVIWLSEQTLGSDYVTRIELPAIFSEHDQRGLRIVPIFVDYSPQEGVDAVRRAMGREIGDHNGHVLDRSVPVEQEITRIARRYATTVLADAASLGRRPVVRCVTRTDAAEGRDAADVNLDWRREYPSDGALPDTATVQQLRDALAHVADETIGAFGAGAVNLELKCHLHLGVAIGHAFRKPTGIIPRVRVGGTWWSAMAVIPDAAEPLSSWELGPGPAQASRAAVEVSLTRDVGPGVDRTIAALGTRYVHRVKLVSATGPSEHLLADETTANVWAQQTADIIAELRTRPTVNDIDLFLAAPLQFSVLLGWRCNVAGVTHVHHWRDNTGPYVHVWTLPAT